MSTRFAVASHILAVIHHFRGEPVASELIATSVNTNPVVVRRILGMLTRAGLVVTRRGCGGGALLARSAGKIALDDIFLAVEDGTVFATHRGEPSCDCPVGRNILPALEQTTAKAEKALLGELARTSLAKLSRQINARNRG